VGQEVLVAIVERDEGEWPTILSWSSRQFIDVADHIKVTGKELDLPLQRLRVDVQHLDVGIADQLTRLNAVVGHDDCAIDLTYVPARHSETHFSVPEDTANRGRQIHGRFRDYWLEKFVERRPALLVK
jgi:hypothetical protein